MNKAAIDRLIAVGLLSLCSVGLAADRPAPGKSFARAFETAKSARLSVQIAAAERDSAAARVAQAKAQLYPTLDLSVNTEWMKSNDTYSGITASYQDPVTNNRVNIDVENSVPRYQTSASVTAQYPVYTGGRLRAQVNRQELLLQAAELSRQLELQQIALDVSSSYFKLRRACMRVSTASRQLRRAQAAASVIGQRLLDGRVAPIEQQISTLAVAEKQAAWRSRLDDLELAYAGYRESIQSAADEERSEQERCRFAGSIESDLQQVRQLSDQTLDPRHDRLKLTAARQEVAVHRADLRPQVSLYANYSGIGRSETSLGDSLSDFNHSQYSVGMKLTFNLFDHGLASQRVTEAEAEVRKEALRAEQASADRDQSKKRRELNARMSQTRLDLLRSRLNLATAQADMARQQLKAGTVSANVGDERIDKEQDARDELDVAQIDVVLANLAAMFPARILKDQ